LGARYPHSQSTRELPYEPKSRALHILGGIGAMVSSYLVVWSGSRLIMAEALSQVLSAARISVASFPSSDAPLLFVKLLDGSTLNLLLTPQRSGVLSVTIFGLLFLLLMYRLEGSIWLKIAWFELGLLLGLSWSLIRVSIAVFVSYFFGANAFPVAEFLTGPITDIFWMVTVWSLMLSNLGSKRRG